MDYPVSGSQFPPTNDSNWCQLASQNRRHLTAETIFSNGWTTLSSHDQGAHYPGPAAQLYGNNHVFHGNGLSEDQMAVSLNQYPKPSAIQPHQLPIYDHTSSKYLKPMAPLPKSRKRKAPTLSLSDWESVKARVIELYVALNLELPDVKLNIEEEFKPYGFTAT
jgi:hypothetical protein